MSYEIYPQSYGPASKSAELMALTEAGYAFHDEVYSSNYEATANQQDRERRVELDPGNRSAIERSLGVETSSKTRTDGGEEKTYADGTKITSWNNGVVKIEKPDGAGAVMQPVTVKYKDGSTSVKYTMKAWGPKPEGNYTGILNKYDRFELHSEASGPEVSLAQSMSAEHFQKLTVLTNEGKKQR